MVPVMPNFLQESGLSVFMPTSSPEFSIQVILSPVHFEFQGYSCVFFYFEYFWRSGLRLAGSAFRCLPFPLRGSSTLLFLCMQILTLPVAPNQTIQAEPGAMCFAVYRHKEDVFNKLHSNLQIEYIIVQRYEAVHKIWRLL